MLPSHLTALTYLRVRNKDCFKKSSTHIENYLCNMWISRISSKTIAAESGHLNDEGE